MTPKQLKFCEAYARLGDGAKAAREAGYAERSARVTASELLTKHDIRERVEDFTTHLRSDRDARHKAVQERLALAAALAIDTLERVLREDGASASAKVAASVAILDRAGHNPKANNDEGGEVIYRIIGGLPDPEH